MPTSTFSEDFIQTTTIVSASIQSTMTTRSTTLISLTSMSAPASTHSVPTHLPSFAAEKTKGSNSVPIAIGVSVGVLVLGVILGLLFFIVRKKKLKYSGHARGLPSPDTLQSNAGSVPADSTRLAAEGFRVSSQEIKGTAPEAKKSHGRALRIAELPS